MAFASARPAAADLFDWSEDDGLFSNGFNWLNASTNTPHSGPPGSDDIASLCGQCTVTGDGGAVAVLEGFGGSTLDVTAPMSADTLLPGGMGVIGTATLTVGTITSSTLTIDGGTVVAGSATNTGPNVIFGGTLHVTGNASELSGLVDGEDSTLDIDGNAENLNLAIGDGAIVDVDLNLTNGEDRTLHLENAAGLAAKNLSIASGFLDVASASAVLVADDLLMTTASGSAPSGGLWTGAGTAVGVGLTLTLVGSGVALQNGAQFAGEGLSLAGDTAPGSLDAQGEGTKVTIGTNGIAVGVVGTATLTTGGGADLDAEGGARVGTIPLSHGSWQITGAGTTAIVRDILVVGELAGSTGTVSVTNAGALQLLKGATVGSGGSGTLTVGSGGQVTLPGAGGPLFLALESTGVGALAISGAGSSVDTNGRELSIGTGGAGSVAMGPGGALTTGAATLGSVLGSSGSVSLGADAAWTANGAVRVGGNSLFPGTGLVQVGTGAVVRAATDLGVFVLGRIKLLGGKVVVGTKPVDSTIGLRVTAGGRLLGDGVVEGPVLVEAGGVVAPGNALGALSVDGDYTQRDGTLAIEVGLDLGAMSKADRLAVTGTAKLGGTLAVSVRSGFTPAPGQQFVVVSADKVTGKFDDVQGAIAVYNPTNVVITVVPPAAGTLARCAKTLGKAGAAFAGARTSALGACVQGALKCLETLGAGAGRDTCLAKAGATCAKQLAKIAGAEDKLRSAVAKACGPLADDTVGAADGLGYDAVGDACAEDFGTPLSTLASVTECVVREHACISDAIVDAEWPRARELLGLAGVPPAALATLACLPDHGGGGGDLGDPKGAGKALTRCVQKTAKASQKLVTSRLQSLQRCAAATFACVSTKSSDPSCLTKATTACDKAFDGLAKAENALSATVAKSCADPPLGFVALTGAAGANVDALGAECATLGVDAVTTLDDYATCLLRRHTCASEALLRFEAPRTATLFPTVGHTSSSAFCP